MCPNPNEYDMTPTPPRTGPNPLLIKYLNGLNSNTPTVANDDNMILFDMRTM